MNQPAPEYKSVIFYSRNYHLGDLWSAANWLCQLAGRLGPISICHETKNTAHSGNDSGDKMIGDLIQRILCLLSGGESVSVVQGHRDTDCELPRRRLREHITPTKLCWNPKNQTIAYQLDSSRYKSKLKDLSDEEIKRIIEHINSMGYRAQRVGLPLSIEESVRSIAEADLFIGIDSGMTHVAYSVGTPVVIVRNKVPNAMLNCHYKRYSQMFEAAQDLIFGLSRSQVGFWQNKET